MNTDAEASRKLSGFLSGGRFQSLLLLAIVSFYIWNQLHNALNPPDLNSIVLINMRSESVEFPIRASMITDSRRWDRVFEARRLFGTETAKNGGVTTLRWDAPFMFGTLEISDGNGVVFVRHAIRPKGRYSGTLVIQLYPEGQVKSSFNEIPL